MGAGSAVRFCRPSFIAASGFCSSPTKRAAIFAAAAIFGLAHAPNLSLMILTFAGGLIWSWVYERAPNLPAIAISHAAVSLCVMTSLPPWAVEPERRVQTFSLSEVLGRMFDLWPTTLSRSARLIGSGWRSCRLRRAGGGAAQLESRRGARTRAELPARGHGPGRRAGRVARPAAGQLSEQPGDPRPRNDLSERVPRARAILDFYRYEFPAVFRRTSRYTVAVAAIFLLIALGSFVATYRDDDFADFAYVARGSCS